MDISVIIVTYNSASVLKPCLESLRNQRLARTTEVLLVDNASRDGTPEMVRRDFSWVKLIANSENVGYSRGVNLGIREARGKYFLILNPDTVVREDSIENLVSFMEQRKDAGIVGPKLVFYDGNVQYSCRRFYTWKVLLLRRTFLGRIFKNSVAVSRHLMLDYDHQTTRDVDWVLGACMFVRKRAVESIGLMDERFFLYFEDVDWCYRMRQKGWKVYYYPGAIITHGYARESAQSVLNRSFTSHLASLIRYYEKWNFLLYFLKKYREVAKVTLFVLIDIVAFNLAFLSAYYLRASLHNIFPNPIFPISVYERFVGFENLLFIFTYFALGLYRIRRETAYVEELFEVGRAIVFASILLMASTYLSHIRTYSRMVVAFLVPFAIVIDWSLRTAVRSFHRMLLSHKIDLKRVCIVGPEVESRALEQRLLREEKTGIEVVGFVATDEELSDDFGGSLGKVSDLERIVDRYRVQELILLPGAVPEERIAEFVSMGRRRVLDVTVLIDYSRLVVHQASISNLAGKPVIAYRRDTRYVLDRVAKRVLDIVLGVGFAVVSLPFYMLYYAYASLKRSRPFSFEERLGLGEKPFVMPVAGSSAADGPSDLVNFRIFWMVIIGKMSMVGPYPFAVEETARIDPSWAFRFDVRPGITGYWRIGKGTRASKEDLLVQDASYIQNWSLLLDFKILLATLGKILFGKKRVLSIERK